MPRKGSSIYSLDVPVDARKSVVQRQLFLIFLPLLIIVAYCVGYIQFRVDHQPSLSRNNHQTVQADQSPQQINNTDLTPQPSASTVSLPTTGNDGASQAGNSSTKVLQNSSSKTSSKSSKLRVTDEDSQYNYWSGSLHY